MKIAIFIDGSNFYSKLKELKIKHTSRFDYNGFILNLTKSTNRLALDLYSLAIENKYDIFAK